MTQKTIGGKPMRHRAGMRRGAGQDIQQGRHRIGMFAALGAVAIGALVLAGAVTGGLWSDAAVDEAQAARQTETAGAKVAQASATHKVSSSIDAKADAAEKSAGKAQSPAGSKAVKAEASRVAGGKSDSLSPDERIERALARVTAGSTDEKVKKAITVAAREKAAELAGPGDTMITAALPDSSAYAPARERSGSSALGAIRDFDKSDEPKAAALEPEPKTPEKAPAAEDQPKAATAAPTGPLGPATVTSAVHLRSGMDNKSAVVTTVPANATVQVSQSCKSWCEVTYNGRHGYIYKDFIRRTAKTDTTAAAPAVTSAVTANAEKPEAGEGILAQTGDRSELAEAAERAQQRRR